MSKPFSESQVEQFHADGLLRCEGFLNQASSRRIMQWVEEISNWPSTSDSCQHHRELTESGPVLARTESFLAHHEELRSSLTKGKIVGAVEQLFGEPACVFKEKINYKHPGGAGFHPHQDAAAYKRFGSLHITCLIAIDPNTVENGCLWFAPGQHFEPLPEDDTGCLPTELVNRWDWVAAPIAPGGVAFFNSLVPHKSLPNHSDQSRRSLYITYGKRR